METTFLNNRRNKNGTKSLKYITSNPSKALRRDFENIEIELENDNLRKMIVLLEGKNKVLEEHCNLLKEKNNLYETKMKEMLKEKEENINDEEVEESDEKSDNQKSTKDKISGILFGVALPKLGQIFSKIKEKRGEMKALIDENCVEHENPCPLQKVDFKEKIEIIKVNLFRVAMVLTTLTVMSGVGYAGYRLWKSRFRHPSYLTPSEDDDDSGDELFRAPGTSHGEDNTSIVKTNSTESFETPGISTDFTSILDARTTK